MAPISVIIPTYNGSAYLAGAVASVWRQTRPPDEIIVADDRSTDGTADLAEDLARRSPVPLRVIRLSKNSGSPARPVNVGVGAARGEYIAVLDQDDVILPDKIADQTAVLQADDSVAAVVSLSDRQTEPGQPYQRPHVITALRAAAAREVAGAWVLDGPAALAGLLRFGNFAYGYPGFMFRRAAWRQKGGVDESLRIASDYELLCWLCTHGRLAVIPKIQYTRRLHEGNLTRDFYRSELDVARVRVKYLPREHDLLTDASASQELRGWFSYRAYGARQEGHYRAAVAFYLLSRRVWGWQFRDLLGVLKIFAHWLLRRARPPAAVAP
jgi:glycosyltransferase involved in cell wall biosynthesis